MTSSRPLGTQLLCGLLVWGLHLSANAALGAFHAGSGVAVQPGGVQRSAMVMPRYTVQEMRVADGSRVQEYLRPDGRVFAVRWNTLYKPDLSQMLGDSFTTYARAAQQAAQRGGVQRQFRLVDSSADLVVHSTGHLHTYAGYAFRISLLPAGVTAQNLGWE